MKSALEHLIDWLEDNAHSIEDVSYKVVDAEWAIEKAKQLQAQEIMSNMTEVNQKMGLYGKEKWAVVHKGQIYDTKEECQSDTAGYELSLPDYTIVKIIES